MVSSPILYYLWYLNINTLFSHYLHYFQPSAWRGVLAWESARATDPMRIFKLQLRQAVPKRGVFTLPIILLRAEGGQTTDPQICLIIATHLREIPLKLSFDSKRSYQMITEARFPQQTSNWAYTHVAFVLSAKNEYLEGKGTVTLVGMPYLRSLKIHT